MADGSEGQRDTRVSGIGAGRTLYKARDGLVIDGVCAGIGEYLRVGSTGVRVSFILLLFVGLWGGLLYLLGMVLIPRSPMSRSASEVTVDRPAHRGWLSYLGSAVMVLGVLIFLGEISLLEWRFWRVWAIGFHAAWPVFVVVLGWVMARRFEPPDLENAETAAPRARVLVRPEEERMVGGVCSGIARSRGVDASLVRVLWAFLAVLSWGVGAVAYAIVFLLIPDEGRAAAPEGPAPAVGIPDKMDPAAKGEDGAAKDPV